MSHSWDQDALFAGLHLVERTGAKKVEIGFLHEDVPAEDAGWYAHAQYHGARVTAEDHPGPVEAVEALGKVEDIGFHFFDESDVVRHRLVQAIVHAYREHRGLQEERF